MKIEKIENNKVKFTFEVTPHEFEHGLDHAYQHVQKDVEVKGFRKGHVPRNIYENKFGIETLYEDALNHVLSHKYQEVQSHPDYEVVGQPKIDVDFEKVTNKEPFEVSLISAIKPEVELGTYKGLEVKDIKTDVSDSEVNAEIKTLLSQNGTLELKEGSLEVGDTAIFDFEGFLDGTPFDGGKAENYSLEIGSGQFIPGFEEQMVGLNPGDEKDLNVTFPEDYQAENLKGKEVTFHVKLHEVKRLVGAELNDAWVESLKRDDVKTVDELKVATKKTLEDTKKQEAQNATTEEVIKQVLANAKVEIPEEMIEEELSNYKANVEQQAKQYGLEMDMFLQLSGVTKEQFEAQALEESKRRVNTTLVMEAIAKKEDIKSTPEELAEKYEELAKRYNMPVEDIKKYIPENLLESDIAINKAYQLVLDSVVKK
ncbi:MAG: trigger factor [Acholeplasmataceae bacterium]|nr:trigger factor [Acholeplasmataceae bacterium]